MSAESLGAAQGGDVLRCVKDRKAGNRVSARRMMATGRDGQALNRSTLLSSVRSPGRLFLSDLPGISGRDMHLRLRLLRFSPRQPGDPTIDSRIPDPFPPMVPSGLSWPEVDPLRHDIACPYIFPLEPFTRLTAGGIRDYKDW